MTPVNTITINTDASHHPTHKVGGYAFYIICNHFKIMKAGAFKTRPKNSTDAETMCIGNALAELAKMELPKTTYLVINTDSKHSISNIERSYNDLSAQVNKIWQKVIKKTSSTVNEFRWVRAHSKVKDSRSYANEWCDVNAKIHMRRALKKKKNEEKRKRPTQ
jgi:ribonuclease HI|tara:strand:+ start:67 stop:555 length:489 start_codon:yes stop_codon:yes gene_type:complete